MPWSRRGNRINRICRGQLRHIGPRNGISILRTLCKPRKISIVRNLLGSILGEGTEDTVGRGLGPAEGTESIEFVGANAHIGPRDGLSILLTLCKPRNVCVG